MKSEPTRNDRRHGTWLRAALAGALALSCCGMATAAENLHRVELENGETLEGILVPASACTLLLQTDDVCLEVPAGKIRSLDGEADLGAALRAERPPLLRFETFEELRPDGTVLMQASFSRRNAGTRIIDEIDWGVAPHELELLRHWTVVDGLGNQLELRVEDRDDGGKQVRAKLVRPILPGETSRFTDRILQKELLQREGELFRYRHRGDYPDDRLVTRMLKLPPGARLESISPDPVRQFEIDGAPVVVWRRYFVKGEVLPFELTYRLGE